jgi:hypothetical protein
MFPLHNDQVTNCNGRVNLITFFKGIKSNIHYMSKLEKRLPALLQELVSANKTQQKSDHRGRTPKEIMTRHILDKNDVITDDDFIQLNISNDIPDDTAPPALEIPDDKERPKDEDKDPAIIIPWDLVG